MRIAMIGTGYVGLVSGACFSEFGIEVACVDNDGRKIESLLAGELPIYEPGLDGLVARNVETGRLSFSMDLPGAVRAADIAFIAVGTPSRRGDGHADLSHAYEAAEEIARALDGYTVVVTKSTVPVGTGREIARVIRKIRPEASFDVASNPEFLREGSAIEDFMRPDRVVVGTDSARAADILGTLYRPLFLRHTPILFTSIESAELTKYAANTFLATKVTFINEIADLCERLGADVQDVAQGIGFDGRIGGKYLHAGPGYGGSCFPKDMIALVKTARDNDMKLQIVEAVAEVNERRKREMAGKIVAACGGSVEGKTIALLGLTFKPNTDDMRESPSLVVVPALHEAGASVRAFDPKGMDNARVLLPGVKFGNDAYGTMEGADALVIVTEWNEFRMLALERVKKLLSKPVVIDFRNVYKAEEMRNAGFDYHGVGRAPVLAATGS